MVWRKSIAISLIWGLSLSLSLALSAQAQNGNASPPNASPPPGNRCWQILSAVGRWASRPVNRAVQGTKNFTLEVQQEGWIRLLTKEKKKPDPQVLLAGLFTEFEPPTRPYRWYQIYRAPFSRTVQLLPKVLTRAATGTAYEFTPVRMVGRAVEQVTLAPNRTYTFGAKLTAGIATATITTPLWQPYFYAAIDATGERLARWRHWNRYLEYIAQDPRFDAIRFDLEAGRISEREAVERAMAMLGAINSFAALQNAVQERRIVLLPGQYEQILLHDPTLRPIFGRVLISLSTDWESKTNFIALPAGERIPREAQLPQLLENLERKILLQYWAPIWFAKGAAAQRPVSGSAAALEFAKLSQDSFWQELIEMRDSGKLSERQFQLRLIEDLEWQARLAEWRIVGYGLRADEGSSNVITLDDIRNDIRDEIRRTPRP